MVRNSFAISLKSSKGVSMKEVTVKVSELQTILEANKAKFIEQYELAKKNYKIHAEVELKNALKKLKVEATSLEAVYVHVTPPQDFTNEYDKVLRMLDMSVNDTITLTQDEFDRYVMNNFNFVHALKATIMGYSNVRS
jgi:hypothetical protein